MIDNIGSSIMDITFLLDWFLSFVFLVI